MLMYHKMSNSLNINDQKTPEYDCKTPNSQTKDAL